jgi:hypothetical protein
MRSTYVLHASTRGYGVRAVQEDLLVWAAPDASPAGTAGLVTFLNTHGADLPPAVVRRMLGAFGSALDDEAAPDERAS